MAENRSAYWQEKLADSRAALLTLLSGLTEEEWQKPVFSEGDRWTVQTVVSHLIDGERGMSIQVHKIRKGEKTIPDDFDLNRWNASVQKRVGDLPPAELLAGLAATRARTVEAMQTLQENEWVLTGRHPARGMITIEQYYETIHGHELSHTADLQKALGRQ